MRSAGDGVKCSFCGKDQKSVGKIIAGQGVYICNECVDLCNDIIGEEAAKSMAAEPSDGRLPPLAPEDYSCDTCGIIYATTTTNKALDAIMALPGRLRGAVAPLTNEVMRTRQFPDVWSPVEYLAHIRDVLTSATIRLYRTRTEDVPAVEPLFNDLRAVRFGYARRSPQALLDEIADDAEGFVDEGRRISDAGWDRFLRRLPGETRTARWLVRQTMHEGEHHLRDINHVAGTVREH